MDDYKDMFADLASFDPAEVIRQMQEKQKEEEATRQMWEKQMEEESNLLGEEQTMPAALAVQEEKKAGRGRKRKEETVGQAQKQIHISIPLSYVLMLQALYTLPGLSVRKILRDAVMNCILEQFKKNGKQLRNMFNKDMLKLLDL